MARILESTTSSLRQRIGLHIDLHVLAPGAPIVLSRHSKARTILALHRGKLDLGRDLRRQTLIAVHVHD